MSKLVRTLFTATALLALTTVVTVPRVRGQIPPVTMSIGIYQNHVLVGEVYRADTDPNNYTEHFVLYPRYVYPSETNEVLTELRPGLTAYRDQADFLARVPFATGSRYVKSSCQDGTRIPGR